MDINRSTTILYADPDNRDSYKLCLSEYNLKCLNARDVNEDTVEITVYGPSDSIQRFSEDYADGSLEPLESMSRSLEFDEDYEGWLNNEVYAFDLLAAQEA